LTTAKQMYFCSQEKEAERYQEGSVHRREIIEGHSRVVY